MIKEIKAEILKEAISTPLQFNDNMNEVYILTKYVLNKTNPIPIQDKPISNKVFVDEMISVLNSRSDIRKHKTLNLVWDAIIKKHGSQEAIIAWNKKRK